MKNIQFPKSKGIQYLVINAFDDPEMEESSRLNLEDIYDSEDKFIYEKLSSHFENHNGNLLLEFWHPDLILDSYTKLDFFDCMADGKWELIGFNFDLCYGNEKRNESSCSFYFKRFSE